MICEIQPPNPNIANAVDYNERKMSGRDVRDHERDASLGDIEDGYVLATRNVPEGTTLLEEFHRLKLVGLKSGKRGPNTKNTTFHMSVNPSATDRPLSDREAVELIDEIMAGKIAPSRGRELKPSQSERIRTSPFDRPFAGA